jgi:hypothetical protein
MSPRSARAIVLLLSSYCYLNMLTHDGYLLRASIENEKRGLEKPSRTSKVSSESVFCVVSV